MQLSIQASALFEFCRFWTVLYFSENIPRLHYKEYSHKILKEIFSDYCTNVSKPTRSLRAKRKASL